MAIILGLLWLRLLGFLKVVNEELATFILASTRVSRLTFFGRQLARDMSDLAFLHCPDAFRYSILFGCSVYFCPDVWRVRTIELGSICDDRIRHSPF